jgi:F1F0 ATPase subunit 2
MTDLIILHLFIAFAAGLVLGLFYFGTLWFTVQNLARAKRPGLITIGGFFIRTGLTLLGFFVVMSGHWERAAACMAGFLVMRKFMTYRYGTMKQAAPQKQG